MVNNNHSDLYEKYYVNNQSSLSVEKQQALEKDLQKLEIKEAKKAQRILEKKLSSKIIIKKIERTKRKKVVSISGLEVFEIDIKKLSKTFSSKFATGCSVVKNAEKKDDIVIQGDLGDECEEYILKLLKEKGLTDIQVEQIEEKKKKKQQQPLK
ncbi:Tma22p [Ascoidea rubescens DSM 1968]|uniref:Translation machinery-associated protein 22 n=1 Tax=Ascoidea rubescens DSM 1968 TaxID=1344418 RepID=A0A1D2VEE5_9ASCO|nr:density-regulated protein DRP1 [Ascoidea rubescens DSM 1968]ODV60021.1 density-regulated protein DRP1 [Ascoidea rubescens DSM 1968]